MGHDAYYKAWAASVARSVLVLKSMLGEDPVMKSGVSARASVEEIVRATNEAVMDAARAELFPQYERFEGLDEGAVTKRGLESNWPWGVRGAEIGAELKARGFEQAVTEDGVVVFTRGSDEIAFDTDGEWMWRSQDETIAGDSLRELQGRINEEE